MGGGGDKVTRPLTRLRPFGSFGDLSPGRGGGGSPSRTAHGDDRGTPLPWGRGRGRGPRVRGHHSPFTPVTTHDPQLGAKTNAPPMMKGKTENRSSVFPLGIGGSLVIPTEGGSVAAVGLD